MRPSILLLGHDDTVLELSSLLEADLDVGTATSVDEVVLLAEMIKFDVVLVLFDEAPVSAEDVARIRAMRRYHTVPILASVATLPEAPYRSRYDIDAWIARPRLHETLLDVLQQLFD